MTQHITKIYGPPGTGKTTRARNIVQHEVASGVPLSRIGYLSFTTGAADVIRERMGATEQDVIWFRTIHSACMKLLLIGRDAVVDIKDYKRFQEETGIIIRGEEYDDWDIEKPFDFTPTKRAYEIAAATQTDVYAVAAQMQAHPNLARAQIDKFGDAWGEFKRASHLFDFTDFLTRYLADENAPALPVDVVILDEAQDLSLLQWLVFHKLARSASRVYMAGDDDQAIYGFIGGSEYGFLDHHADEEEVITKSHRVPVEIGEFADSIIRRVQHRKAKDVEWRPVAGTIRRMNLDAFSLPWRQLTEQYESIMVLSRHRKGARRFSDDLKSLGIMHDLNGEGLAAWPEARIAHTFLTLKDGGKVTVKQAKKLLDEMGVIAPALQGMKPRALVGREVSLGVDWDRTSLLDINPRKTKRYEAIRQTVYHDGAAILVKPPAIRVSTMHAAKGDEAELIIVVPECTSIVTRNILSPSEIRLAYVTVTRAKKDVIVLIPRSDNYIKYFFGG